MQVTMFNRRNLDVFLIIVYLLLIFRPFFSPEAREIRPAEHGLPYQEPAAISPTTVSFFRHSNSSSGMALPEARNSSDPIWGFIAGSPPVRFRQRKVKADNPAIGILLLASLVCGGVGIVLLVAALYAFFVRKSKG